MWVMLFQEALLVVPMVPHVVEVLALVLMVPQAARRTLAVVAVSQDMCVRDLAVSEYS
jgi:hypothetical protein